MDALGFDAVAEDLADLIVRSASADGTPLVVGIQGSWGTGKSSLMRRIERRLKARRPEVKTIWFNVWAAERADVLEGLIKSVLLKLDTNILRRALRHKTLMTSARVLLKLVAGFLRAPTLVDEIWDRAAVDARTRNELGVLIHDAMKEWIGKSKTPGSRFIVIFVDDLDRCDSESVFAVFEAAKAYLDARGFVFVIGYDESVISEAILHQKKYANVTSRDYLDKIIQIVYRISAPSDEQARSLLRTYARESGTDRLLNDDASGELVIEGNRRNPRGLKRFINAFVLEHRLGGASTDAKQQRMLVSTLILQMYFPEFTRLYSDRARLGDGPIQEFIDYLTVREMLLGKRQRDEELITRFQRDHDVDPRPDLDVAQLDTDVVDESFARLVGNAHFVSIVRALQEESAQQKVQERLAEAAASIEGQVDEGEVPELAAPSARLERLRVLWIDDNPTQNANLIARLRRDGASVATATSGDEAQAALRSGPFDVVVSDLARGGEPEAGFTDAERFRDEGLFAGPFVFYVARITTGRRERAKRLGAAITTNAGELLNELASLAARATSARRTTVA
jgi:CheY-like chemotaxis protein